jgi:hypothetical protein
MMHDLRKGRPRSMRAETADYLARAREGLADAKQIAALPMSRRARRTLPPITPPAVLRVLPGRDPPLVIRMY